MLMRCISAAHPRVLVVLLLAVSLCFASPRPQAQKSGYGNSFVINPNRPYVYLKFDHIGKGTQRWESEPTSRIWLRLTNNCRLSITINTYGVPDGSPKDEQGVMDMIVAIEPPQGMGYGIMRDGTVQPKPFVKARPDELPHDYWFEVGSFQSVPPGRALLFSVPINHVGPRWYFEIPFHFEGVNGKFPRDPSVGGFPEMSFHYTMSDLPPEAQREVERWYDSKNSQAPPAKSCEVRFSECGRTAASTTYREDYFCRSGFCGSPGLAESGSL